MSPAARRIIEDVCAERGVALQDILRKCRKAEVVFARAEIARQLDASGYSLTQIGAALNKDHTTVLYYLGRAKRKLSIAGSRGAGPAEKLKLRWRKPRVRHLCYVKQPKPKKFYLIPYCGADFRGVGGARYVWKERPRREEAA